MPPSEGSWGTFGLIAARSAQMQQTIITELARGAEKAAPGSNAQKVSGYYATALDPAALEATGLSYLRPYLARIAALHTLPQTQWYLADPPRAGRRRLVYPGSGPDEKYNTQYAVLLSQGGLGLPSRDYYLAPDARSRAVRAARRHRPGVSQASQSEEVLRDPYANYHQLTGAQAGKDFSSLNLPQLLKARGLGVRTVIVGQPAFFRAVSAPRATAPLADQRQYLRWHLVSSATAALPRAFAEDAPRFGQVLTGTKRQRPRRQYALRAANQALGEAFGQFYVDSTYRPTTRPTTAAWGPSLATK